ncbi:MAG TPA: class I SAM-dependent methyltransferase [Acidimicrobiales bacterium]|nr:class I SAM-dependent methyltransferase [Acidimicrobiales bacterium]
MGVYNEQVVPRLVEWTCGSAGFDRWRERTTEGLAGRVVEIGFGSGLNVPHYPPEVDTVLAVEPASVARRRAERRIRETQIHVEHVGLDGQALPLADASCDAALCTFTLCTVADPAQALSELMRVLKPAGTVHFLEHGLSPDEGVAKWQHRIEPLQRRLADGCHLTRDPSTLVERAGFVMERNEQRYVKGPKPWCWLTLGVAAKPAGAGR